MKILDVKQAKFATQIEPEVLERLRRFAKEQDRSISRVVNDAVLEYLDRAAVRPAVGRAMDEVLDEHAELLARLARLAR